MKRWTREAKIRMIQGSHNIGVQENPQESIGKRYSFLSHNFREISTLAAESENMYEYACESFTKLLKNFQMIDHFYQLCMKLKQKLVLDVQVED